MATADITLLGATYYGVPSVVLPTAQGGTAEFTLGGGGGGGVVPIIVRSDAELVEAYTYDKRINADEGVTIPAYTTTAQVLKASASLTPTVALDLANYNYYVCERFLAIPEYSVTTKGKGRAEYYVGVSTYDVCSVEAGTMHALLEPTRVTTARTVGISAAALSRLLYYSSSSAVAAYNSASYAAYETANIPTVNGTTLTLKSPALGVRGHTTYFTSTYMNALTDIRYQWRIEVWRVAKSDPDTDGWQLMQGFERVCDATDASDHTLR